MSAETFWLEGLESLGEDGVAVLNDELDGQVLGVHVRHFTFDAAVKHDGRGKDDC